MTDAVLAQLFAIRAALDAVIITAQSSSQQAQPIDPREVCPNCGASGETQLDTSTLDGTKRVKCARCQQEREL